MIDITIVNRAVQLKKEADAAYLVFKKLPTTEAASRWTEAVRIYNDYCVKVMTELVNAQIEVNTQQADILANFAKYSKCEHCDAELLFPTRTEVENEQEMVLDYIASSDFMSEFPGWCYPCLLEYCTSIDCVNCTIKSNPTTCSFAEVKKLQS
jgi:hypothetical protein